MKKNKRLKIIKRFLELVEAVSSRKTKYNTCKLCIPLCIITNINEPCSICDSNYRRKIKRFAKRLLLELRRSNYTFHQ